MYKLLTIFSLFTSIHVIPAGVHAQSETAPLPPKSEASAKNVNGDAETQLRLQIRRTHILRNVGIGIAITGASVALISVIVIAATITTGDSDGDVYVALGATGSAVGGILLGCIGTVPAVIFHRKLKRLKRSARGNRPYLAGISPFVTQTNAMGVATSFKF